ncbi:MAG: septum formation initiator family protein [Syntrophobacterales bacterium]|nr:septum formation initiator family protein [Syntrophobacterales bacterium]
MPRSPVGGDMTSPGASVETQKWGGGYKILVGIALVMALAMALVILFSHRGLYQIYRFRTERLHLEQENARLAAENERLARTIDRLHHDPEFIQDRIRQELNFVRRNEIIFQFPPEKPVVASAPTPAAEAPQTDRTPGIAERKTNKSRWVAEPQEASSKKKAARRRE